MDLGRASSAVCHETESRRSGPSRPVASAISIGVSSPSFGLKENDVLMLLPCSNSAPPSRSGRLTVRGAVDSKVRITRSAGVPRHSSSRVERPVAEHP